MTTPITPVANIHALLDEAVAMMERGEMPWLVDVGGKRFSLIHAIKVRFEDMEMFFDKYHDIQECMTHDDGTVRSMFDMLCKEIKEIYSHNK